jgi:hypothetical protein
MRIPAAALIAVLALPLTAQHPRDSAIHDTDTKSWWHTTEDLSNDSMEGRDTGTAAYQHAADMVAARFKAAGLQPAGENNSYFQTVPMHQIDVLPEGTSFAYTKPGASPMNFPFLQEINVTASALLPASLEAKVVFRGYCGKDEMQDVAGKFVLCYGARRTGLTTAAERSANVRAAGAVGIINVDDLAFILEPARWPDAYARSVTLRDTETRRAAEHPFVTLRISGLGFSKLIADKDHEPGTYFMAAAARLPLPSFDLPGIFTIHTAIAEKDISSPNILAVLPGSDPKLKDEYVVIAAHLDGYGFGTPVNGDNLYNGALDDAAYVALLIQMADDIKSGKLPQPKRSILFAAFTGEEKGLLGSNWFVAHLTIPKEKIVADVNLDQLRPLFPLNILTAEAVNDTTLGQTARDVGVKMRIEIRPDNEPERGLLRRADQYPFLRIGVPAISFIFGYDPGTDAERRYREWYNVRYHRPQDDLTQPMDFDAAAKFNTFFYRLVDTIADAPTKPSFLEGSQFAAKK